MLEEANNLINKCISGELDQDFLDEANSYWNQNTSSGGHTVLSLVNLEKPSRSIYFWKGASFIVCGDKKKEVQAWVINCRAKLDDSISIEQGVFIWMKQPILPTSFPKNAADVYKLVSRFAPNETSLLDKITLQQNESILVVLAAPTSTGPFCGGVIINAPKKQTGKGRSHDLLSKGFRRGKISPKVLIQRFFGNQKIIRSPVERIEAEWIHGRFADKRIKKLRDSTVAVIGCGSVGGHVTILLAQSGVGKFVLVDPDSLNSANISRHPLGANYIKQSKSNALTTELLQRFPHLIDVQPFNKQWEQLKADEILSVLNADLIISTIGNTGAELALNNNIRNSNQKPDIIFGWLEPYACASHAVFLKDTGACFRCGFTDMGIPKLCATKWSNDTTLIQEPACGVTFQPYSTTELHNGVTLVTELAIDILIKEVKTATHRIRVEKKKMLTDANGMWTEEWLNMTGNDDGGFSFERPWELDEICNECH